MKMKITLKNVADAVLSAKGWTEYYPSTNRTIGPYNVKNLSGPRTGRYYNQTREWDTEIAVAMAEDEFNVDLSRYDIVNSGPWRETVRSIHAAVNTELNEELEYNAELNRAVYENK
jgi:hypothetical protein